MRLFFDARYIATTGQNGISRYSIELGRAVEKVTNDVTFLISDRKQIKFLPKGIDYLKIHKPTSWKEPFTALILNRHSPDVVFSPMQTMGSLGRKYKLILTLHDMIYYRHRTPPGHFNWLIRMGWRIYHATYIPQRWALNGADAVATVSKTSKRDILKAKLTKRPVVVIPNAPQQLAHFLGRKAITKIGNEKPRNLIYMGSFMEYKNVETLVRGMEFLPDHTLHLLSRISPERRADYKSLSPKGSKIVFHNGVSDEQYARIMATGAILVSASLDEGYGIPIADAMALGVPAVITDMPIFHEVAGTGALYFNPNDPSDFAKKITEASNLDNYRRLSDLGKKQSQRLSWDESAKSLLAAVAKI